MKIERFTKIFNIEERFFLVNYKTGAMDEVEDYIIKEINELKKKGSFTPLECGLEESLIEKMIERGYITYYSDREAADEINWLVERYKEEVKKEKKTAAILLDPIVGEKWCSLAEGRGQKDKEREIGKNLSMNRVEIGNILSAISKGKLVDEIDLWLMVKNRIDDWSWLKEEAGKNGLKIKSLYTFSKNKIELMEIKDWLKTSILFPITINVKYEAGGFNYISLFKSDEKNIYENEKITFLEKHPFFCPFVYRTFFMDKTGNISYCVKKLINGNKIGRIDISTGGVNLENGWSKELFTPFCEKDEDCIYSIYCQKMCTLLDCLYENQINGYECNIVSKIKTLTREKIMSMM